MKKLFCLIVTITLLFANVISVNALELKQGQTITIDTDYSVSITDNDPNDANKTSTIHLYKSSYGHAYCEDANLEGPANGYKTYTITDILDEKDYREAGLIDILKNDLNGGDRLGINVAIRMFNIIHNRTAGGSKFPFTTAAYVNLTKNYCKSKGCTTSVSAPSGYENAEIKFSEKTTTYNTYLDSAMKAAEDAKNAKTETGTGTSKVTVNGPTESTDKDGTKMVVYTFKIPTVEEGQDAPIKNIVLEAGTKIGPLQYKDNNSWQTATGNKIDDPYSIAQKNNNILTIGFTYEKANEEDCSELEYTIKYEELGAVKEYIAAEATAPSAQRFLLIIKNDDAANDGYAPKELTGAPECEAEPQPCETQLSTPVCADDANEDAIASVIAPVDIKTCILNNKDDAGNYYKLESFKNSYCSLFCKEDYAEIKMTNAIDDVKCLGYLQLKAYIKGSKDCYLSTDDGKALNTDQLKKNIVEAQEKAIEEYNDYSEQKAIESAKTSCTTWYYYHGNTEEEIPFEYYKSVECTVSYSYKYYTYNKTETEITNLKLVNSGTITKEYDNNCKVYDDWDYQRYEPSSNYTDVTYDYCNKKDPEQQSKSFINSANPKKPTDMTEAVTKEINEYNACSELKSNVTTFKFAQQLEWDYNEGRFDGSTNADLVSPYKDLLKPGDNIMKSTDAKVDQNGAISYCSEEVTNEFECPSWQGASSKNIDVSYYICTESGCKTDSQKVYDTKYAKIHFDGESNYITDTVQYQVYPSARVGDKTMESQGFVGLEEKLATSPLLVGGGTFSLKMKNLGEFYNNSDSGRLIDYGGKNEKNSVANAKKGAVETVWDGNYVCHYYSPCQPSNCPKCSFNCVGDGCKWNINGCTACEFKCALNGCLISMGDVKASTKTISTTALAAQTGYSGGKAKIGGAGGELAAEFREFGYNWNINTGIKKFELITSKAKETIKEIDEKNSQIYAEKKNTNDTGLDFSITLTQSMIKTIKSYNSSNLEKGSYANDTLTCYPYTDKNGVVYENIFCYSDVLTEWLNKTDKKNKYVGYRDPSGAKPGKYWIPWTGENAELAADDKVAGGPSWK